MSESDSNEPGTSRTPTPKPIAPRPKRKQQLTPTDELIQLTGQHLKSLRPNDEFEAYGKYVAHKLRSLKGMQAVFARKLINDVIFQGEIEELDKDFKVTKIQCQTSLIRNDFQGLCPQQNSPYHHQSYDPQVYYPQQQNSRPSNNILQLKTMPLNPQTIGCDQMRTQYTSNQQLEPQLAVSKQTTNLQTEPKKTVDNNVSTYFSNFTV